MWSDESGEKISRRRFLRIAFSSIPVAALIFASGCAGEEDDEEEEDDD